MLSRAISYVKQVASNSFSGSISSNDTDSEYNEKDSVTNKSFSASASTDAANAVHEHHSNNHGNKNIFRQIQARSPIRLRPRLAPLLQTSVSDPKETSTPKQNSTKAASPECVKPIMTIQDSTEKDDTDYESISTVSSDAETEHFNPDEIRITNVRSLLEDDKDFTLLNLSDRIPSGSLSDMSCGSTPQEVIDFTGTQPKVWTKRRRQEEEEEEMEVDSQKPEPVDSAASSSRTENGDSPRKCFKKRTKKRVWLKKKFYVRESNLIALVQHEEHALHKWADVITKENLLRLSKSDRDAFLRILAKLVDFDPVPPVTENVDA